MTHGHFRFNPSRGTRHTVQLRSRLWRTPLLGFVRALCLSDILASPSHMAAFAKKKHKIWLRRFLNHRDGPLATLQPRWALPTFPQAKRLATRYRPLGPLGCAPGGKGGRGLPKNPCAYGLVFETPLFEGFFGFFTLPFLGESLLTHAQGGHPSHGPKAHRQRQDSVSYANPKR